MTHICDSKIITIGSDNGLSPGRRQAIIWTNAWILLIQIVETNFSEILIDIHTFSFKEMHLNRKYKYYVYENVVCEMVRILSWPQSLTRTKQITSKPCVYFMGSLLVSPGAEPPHQHPLDYGIPSLQHCVPLLCVCWPRTLSQVRLAVVVLRTKLKLTWYSLKSHVLSPRACFINDFSLKIHIHVMIWKIGV